MVPTNHQGSSGSPINTRGGAPLIFVLFTILSLTILSMVFLSGCAEQNPDTNAKYTGGFKEIPVGGIGNTNPSADPNSGMDTIMHISGEEWAVSIDLPGYVDLLDKKELPSRFLIKERLSDKMAASIFAEIIESVDTSMECRDFYTFAQEKTRRSFAEAYKEVAVVTPLEASIYHHPSNDYYLLWYNVTMRYGTEEMRIKSMNAFFIHDGYCFDVHMSKTGFEDEDIGEFYKILDSIEMVDYQALGFIEEGRLYSIEPHTISKPSEIE